MRTENERGVAAMYVVALGLKETGAIPYARRCLDAPKASGTGKAPAAPFSYST
ncbi:MAG: hypothetical protein WEA58_07225 [Balneolaceae bacterium]